MISYKYLFLRSQWAEVRSGSKSISRSILNGRRMDFDLDQDFLKEAGGLGKFVEDLLETSLSFSLSSLERDPERLVKFLNAVSHLRLVPIIGIDRRGTDAFCLFVNLYHCLLQHALLLAVNGPLHRRTVGHFMRASCYEIGGDVFSLAEIQSCIIRGNMSRPISPKPPYVDVSKKSNAYRYYALKYTDPRVNFVLVRLSLATCMAGIAYCFSCIAYCFSCFSFFRNCCMYRTLPMFLVLKISLSSVLTI